MNVVRFSVQRPVFTTMATLIVIILGAVSLSRLPVDLMPDISDPTLAVITTYENASPEEIEEMVTRPIEEAMGAVPGVEEVSSVSSEGNSTVEVTFSWDVDLDAAANDIRDRLDRVIPRLPEDADRPILRKFDPSSFPILVLGASSRLDPIQTRKIIDDEVKYRIERVPGVAAVDVWGGLEREIHVDIFPDKLKALQIPLAQVVEAVKAANVTLPAGSVESGVYDITLRTPGQFVDIRQIGETTLAVRDGAPIKLAEVAEVTDRWQKVQRIIRVNGAPGLRLSVNKQSGANTVEVARRVLDEIEKINQDIPQVTVSPIIDTSDYIRRSIANAGSSALYGGGLAILTLLFFLRSARSAVVIGLAIPVSIVATFALVYFGGYTLNLMTLGGLALGVGMLVDNSIVALENIFRIRSTGAGPAQAAVRGAEEVAAAIVASTLTTVVIFLPLVFVRGMAGVMFKQLALVVSFALLCSLAVALTLIPMLSSRFFKPSALEDAASPGFGRRILRASESAFSRLELAYRDLLGKALNHRGLVVGMALAILAGSLALTPLIGVELMPQADEGEVRATLEMEVGARLDLTDQAAQKAALIVTREVPEIKNMVVSIGGSPMGGGEGHIAEFRIALVPKAQRARSSEEIAGALRKKLAGVPGTEIRTRAGQGLFLIRRMTGGGERVEVEIRGYDLETSEALALRVKQIVEKVRGVTDARISRDLGAPERIVTVDRAKAEALKVSVKDVAETLQTALSGTLAGNFREDGDEYSIRVKLKDGEKMSLREILNLSAANADGLPVVLRNVVSLAPHLGPVQIERKDQERIVSVQANIEGRDLGSILGDVQEALRSLPVPKGFSIGFGGDYEEQRKAFRELALGLVLALVLVYMVMACLYESLRDPFVVMFSVPLAVVGVILMLLLTNTTFNMQSFIGCVMLGGIVVNNAILLVDHVNLLRRERNMPMRQAIEEAGQRRLRPILMTALTTVFGLIPLALGLGEGGEAQAPMARAVIGGLVSSTLITLVVIPVIYSLFEGRKGRRLIPDKGMDEAPGRTQGENP